MANVLEILIRAKDEASAQLGEVNKSVQGMSREMKIAAAAMVGLTAAVGGLTIKMAVDFDKAMREVNTLINLNEAEFKGLTDEVRELSRALGVDAVESSQALYQAISAGVPRENVLDFLSIASKAAIGGVTDTTTAVDGLTTVLNAFKIPITEAQRVADIMFTTVKGGKTTFDQLSGALFNVAPIAAASGVKFEEVSAALASITKQGVPTSVATTQLRAAIQALTAPTVEQKKRMEELGFTMDASVIQSEGLASAFNKVYEATGGNMEILRKLVGSVEGVQAILALTGENAEVFAADLDAMANSAGAATEAFEQMEQSTARKLEKLKTQLKDIGIEIGQALIPVLERFLKWLVPVIEKLSDWVEENGNVVLTLMAIVGGIGTLILAAAGISKVIGVFRTLKAVLIGVQIQATAMWAAITLGISLAVLGIIKLVDHLNAADEATQDFDEAMKDLAYTMKTDVEGAAQAQLNSIEATRKADINAIQDRRNAWKDFHIERMSQITSELLADLQAILPEGEFIAIQEMIEGWEALQGNVEETQRTLDELTLADLYQELKDLTLSDMDRARIQRQIDQLEADKLANQIFDTLNDIAPTIADQLADTESPAATYYDTLITGVNDAAIEASQAWTDVWDTNFAASMDDSYDAAIATGRKIADWYKENLPEMIAPSYEEHPALQPSPAGGLSPYTGEWPISDSLWDKIKGFLGLEHGGIVTRPTRALIGEAGPEAVIPLSQMPMGETHIHVGYLMGDETSLRRFVRHVQQMMGEENRRTQFGQVQEGYYFGRSAP